SIKRTIQILLYNSFIYHILYTHSTNLYFRASNINKSFNCKTRQKAPIKNALKGEITPSFEKNLAVHPAKKPVRGLTITLAITPIPPKKKRCKPAIIPAPKPT